MKMTTMLSIIFTSSIVYSQNIPREFKHNWISVVYNPDNVRSFDSLLLLPDNDKIDTGKMFYIYWAYHGRNNFFWGYFDKREPRSELASCNYEKWKLHNDNNVLRIKNCKTRDKVYYKIVYNYDNVNDLRNILLIKLADKNLQNSDGKRITGYHK